ncbi:DUF1998 domain-containing protein [Flavimobilis sp. GY10621]|uniref:DUF1998 domain-containing protein n=1 Tax=Flavimobilis rhizosphaerae TaxID=2775421 RepID=A0ABR9DPY9_9MICO|nr:DUF1998 domain-containing protein [Flavimobilis rhizosphaerae]MBD9699186.1 DUF1998 domain-containing protein [Flavimobilis rhizosphaerae]
MATTDIGKARQSQLILTYGVGSLIPAGDQSFIICGIDSWNERFATEVEEPRLARSLGVATFKAPPAGGKRDIPVSRFPLVHYCSGCRRLGRPWEFGGSARDAECKNCVKPLTPSRFVACCEAGHIEDFPYFQWLHRGQTQESDEHTMSLKTRGMSSSLADIEIHCTCNVRPVSMQGAFDRSALLPIKSCSGRRPWLPGAEPVECRQQLRTLQRGSANVWFPATRSTISIPPWTGPTAELVSRLWPVLENLHGEALVNAVESTSKPKGVPTQAVVALVERRRGIASQAQPTESELRAEEYAALVAGSPGTGSGDNFVCLEVDVDDEIAHLVAQVSSVPRLREVRALHSFSRVTPTEAPENRGALSLEPCAWLPAVEVLGEGIFVRLDESLVRAWSESPHAQGRAAMIATAAARAESQDDPIKLSARYIAIHSLAHAVLQELSLDAGYPVSSLRERVYAESDQAGFLIYTASSDSAGSLGGLAALSKTERFATTLRNAIDRISWCSADPVCSESRGSGADGLNLAACHACLLLPETSCEDRNSHLDRVSVIGTLSDPEVGLVGVLE